MADAQESIVGRLLDQACLTPEALAFRYAAPGADAPVLSYAALVRSAAALAAALVDHANPGDRVVLLCRPGLDSVVAVYACLMAGLIAVPCACPHVNRLASQSERLISVVRDCSPAVILAPRELVERRDAFAALAWELAIPRWLDVGDAYPDAPASSRVTATDVAFLQYTSGSTAAPRGVRITHGNLVANQELVCQVTRPTRQTELMSWLPFYHDMGLCFYFHGVFLGIGTTLMSPLDFARRPLDWLEVLSRYRCSGTAVPAFALDRITDHLDAVAAPFALDLGHVRALVVGAERIAARTIERFCAAVEPLGWKADTIFPCYGLAESTLMVTRPAKGGAIVRAFDAEALTTGAALGPADPERPVATLVGNGHPGAGHRVLVVDPATRVVLPDHGIGEIWVAGPSVSPGYWSPQADHSNFRATTAGDDEQRYLRTGDLGFWADDELFVAGRCKDLIIVRGRNIYPDEIEQTVRAADASVGEGAAAIEWADTGNIAIVAELRQRHLLDAETTVERIRRAVACRFAVEVPLIALCAPKSLPRTSSGKVRRSRVRALLEEGILVPLAGWQPVPTVSPGPAPTLGEPQCP